jgi:hypothetical protein
MPTRFLPFPPFIDSTRVCVGEACTAAPRGSTIDDRLRMIDVSFCATIEERLRTKDEIDERFCTEPPPLAEAAEAIEEGRSIVRTSANISPITEADGCPLLVPTPCRRNKARRRRLLWVLFFLCVAFPPAIVAVRLERAFSR